MPTFKDRLNELFKELNLSQVSLSKKTGIAQSSLSEYLLGKKEPTISIVTKIAIALGISLDWLLLGEGKKFRDGNINPDRQIPIEDIPKEQIKEWLDSLWQSADKDTRIWLEIEIKRRFTEYSDWLQKHKESDLIRAISINFP